MINHDTRVLEDMKSMLCGEWLGEGVSRDVYAHATDPDLVVKVGKHAHHANIVENHLWTEFRDVPTVARWLAPCVRLSIGGLILFQRRVRPIRPNEMCEQLPAFLCDKKPENFGILDGRVVCCDYAIMQLTAGTRLRKAEWLV